MTEPTKEQREAAEQMLRNLMLRPDASYLVALLAEREAALIAAERAALDLVDEHVSECDALRQRLSEAETARKPLVEALELAEWGGSDTDRHGDWLECCPVCAHFKELGHAESCELRAALSSVQRGESGK